MRLIGALALVTAIGVITTANHVTAAVPTSGMVLPITGIGQRAGVATCTIQQETATDNSRRELAYYECLAVNGAIVPAVTFVVFADSSGELWLRELTGRTVDVRLEVVR